ncbi:cytochrome P450 alkane hydroxylase [Polyplosphaeria fusca]|uniref:Cytochrome P450 alkane hydroxylase n=1 Tax=Polyplosphaeria fusca TaxID=682080 RepID=A0A9P4QL98_9PLEO|nr:cytochrome P450 alkane hydroxylase [Polyplosphaeria fusca]
MAFSWIVVLFTVAAATLAFVFYFQGRWTLSTGRLNHATPPALKQKDRLLGFKLLQEIGRQSKEGVYLVNAQKRFEETGYTFSMVLAGSTIIQTAEPENIKAVLGERQPDFDSGSVRFWSAEPLLGKGIFTSDGATWVHSRALLKPCFSTRDASDLPLFETHLQRLFARLPASEKVIDLQPLFFQLSMDVSTVSLLGESTNCLLGNPQGEEFARAFEFCSTEIMTRVRMGKLMFLHRSRKFKDMCSVCHRFADQFVQKALQAEKMGSDDHQKKRSVLDELITQTRDPLELRSQLLHLLLAGRDTTASVLSSLFFVLAKRPDVWQRVREEVSRYDTATPSHEQLKECKYLGHVLKEVLRLYPVIVSNSRMANKDTLLPRGGGQGHDPILVKKGQIVAYNYYVLHRRTDLFGEDAASFRPERWETARPRWSYLPFGGGPRICIGQQFAQTEVLYTLFRFAQTFASMRSVDPGDWEEKISITCTVQNGVKIVLS